MEFQPNDGVIWYWRDPEWHLVCEQITPSVVYRDLSAQFFALGVRDHAGREFRISAGNLFSRRASDLVSALAREGIRVFDATLTAQYLHTNMPVGKAIDDPSILPSTATGCHASFRKAWDNAKRGAHV
jgi:hypothetical protein